MNVTTDIRKSLFLKEVLKNFKKVLKKVLT